MDTIYVGGVFAMYASGEEVCVYTAPGPEMTAAKVLASGMAKRIATSSCTSPNILKVYADVAEIRMGTRKAATVYKATFDRTGQMTEEDYTIENW